MEYLLKTDGLTKQYGKKKAVSSVDIHIKQGDIYGLIGRNGAGKTTILKMLCGLAKPTAGDFSLFGYSGKDLPKVLHRVGSLIEEPGLYPRLSVAENVQLKCIAMGVLNKEVVPNLLKCVGLNDVGKKPVGKLSLGMKKRLGIALALVGEPDLVILDEPVNGLDPQGMVEIREIIEKMNKEKGITFIISSHNLEQLSKFSTKYGIIHNGVLLQEFTNDELLERCSERIELKTDDTASACTALEAIGINKYKVININTIHIFEHISDSGDIVLELANNKVKIASIELKNDALEDYYFSLTGGSDNV